MQVREKVRDAFRFLSKRNGKEKHRFTRVPFGVEASPFLLGATLQYHYDKQPPEFESRMTVLGGNKYVDNTMQDGEQMTDLDKFKRESKVIFDSAKFLIH